MGAVRELSEDDDSKSRDRVVGCRSEYELYTPDTDIVVVGGPGGGGALKANRSLDVERRRELIKAVRGGEHVELELKAITFRQRDGSPNKNFLRLNPAKLGDIAATYAKKPFLDDHRSWLRSARQGTITSSEAVELAHGWIGFRQGLNIVKPEAVISVLDGTLDRFSIGWSRIGAVFCSAHKTDVTKRGSCDCWPGDRVEVDGKQHVVEFEFENAEGTETSGVNSPAVSGTRIEDVRAALAVELGISRPGEKSMNLVTTLAAILGCAATEAEVTRATEARARELADAKRGQLAAEQERDTLRTELKTAKDAAAKAVAQSLKAQVDAEIDGAYRSGKLLHGRDDTGKATPSPQEEILRSVAKDYGLEGLKKWLGGMPQLASIGKRALESGDPVRTYDDDGMSGALANVAEQLGLKVEDLEAEYASLHEER